MLSAENRVLITKSLLNPMLCSGALLAILQDQLPSNFNFEGAIRKLNFSELGYKQLSSMMSVQGLPAVIELLEDRLELSFAELREQADNLKAIEDSAKAAVKMWKATRPEYKETPKNRELLLEFLDNPQQFGYYVASDGVLRYNLDGSTPASKLAKAEANLAQLQNIGLQSKTGRARLDAAKAEVERLQQEVYATQDKQSLEITSANLEAAYVALMSLGRLQEHTPAAPAKRNQDPSLAADGDTLPRKKVANMSATEFAQTLSRSPKFRDKIDGSPSTLIPAELSERQRNTRREIAALSSIAYDERYQSDPEFRKRIAELDTSDAELQKAAAQ